MKKYAVCIDSDGCAMDTMTMKHQCFFAPFAAQSLKVTNENQYIEEWLNYNLYQLTRGINRFECYAIFAKKYREASQIERLDITPLLHWIEQTSSFSESALEKAISDNPAAILHITLAWSQRVNRAIAETPASQFKVFAGVADTMALIKRSADVYVVSSANKKAVVEEWSNNGLIEYVDACYTQEDGSKKAIIARIIEMGYANNQVIMLGDAVKDRDAALQNDVAFYPILARCEVASWQQFSEAPWRHFLNGSFEADLQTPLLQAFVDNLS